MRYPLEGLALGLERGLVCPVVAIQLAAQFIRSLSNPFMATEGANPKIVSHSAMPGFLTHISTVNG